MNQAVDFLVSAQYVITCEEANRVLKDHSIAVSEGRIVDILPTQDAIRKYSAPRQSFDTHAILPGFINAHTHLAMNAFRGLADDMALLDWLTQYIWPAETKWVSESFVYDASKLAIAELIRSGTTCFNDMYFFPEATARVTEEAGIRGHIGMTIIDVPTVFAQNTEEYFARAGEFYAAFHHHPLVTPTFAPHSTYTVSIDNLARVQALAIEQNCRINIHLQEAASEVAQSNELYHKRPLARLAEIGMVSDRLIAIHMTQINEEDEQILKQYQPHLVHCPESNMKLSSGASPVEKLSALGLNIALGTDGAASNNDLSMLGEMKTAAFLAKLSTGNPKALSAETVLKMATIRGAKALGIEHDTGSLTVGKSADFIAIKLDEIETMPLYHPVSQIVYSASRRQVTDVWVKGKQLLKERALLTLDEAEVKAKTNEWRDLISA